MARIKCIFRVPICNCNYGAKCECAIYGVYDGCESYDKVGSKRVFDDRCRFTDWETHRFEKNIKNYEWDCHTLTMGKKWILADLIEELEIDGEKIIEKGL